MTVFRCSVGAGLIRILGFENFQDMRVYVVQYFNCCSLIAGEWRGKAKSHRRQKQKLQPYLLLLKENTMRVLILLPIFLIIFSSCGHDCIDNKTGMSKASRTIQESKEINVFQFEMVTTKNLILLDSGRLFKIKNAWVENRWSYECLNNRAVVKKDSNFQMVIDGKINYEGDEYYYWLMEGNSGSELRSILSFKYSGQDTLKLSIVKSKILEKGILISNIEFYRK